MICRRGRLGLGFHRVYGGIARIQRYRHGHGRGRVCLVARRRGTVNYINALLLLSSARIDRGIRLVEGAHVTPVMCVIVEEVAVAIAAKTRHARGKQLVLVLVVLGYGQVEHERVRVDAHVERLVQENASDRLERLEVVDLQVPLAVAELDDEQLLHVNGIRVETELQQSVEEIVRVRVRVSVCVEGEGAIGAVCAVAYVTARVAVVGVACVRFDAIGRLLVLDGSGRV